uniref:CULLIN_2 domain-containing protein n=1 Tax=Macrostomum lignano TaxID=282301 RepID=A0A1I8F476_9PLAT
MNRNAPNAIGGGASGGGGSGGGSNNSYSKMRIKAFPMSMDERYKNNSGLSFEELYRNAYTLVLHKYGEKLYSGTRDVVAEHMAKIKDDVLASVNNNLPSVYNMGLNRLQRASCLGSVIRLCASTLRNTCWRWLLGAQGQIKDACNMLCSLGVDSLQHRAEDHCVLEEELISRHMRTIVEMESSGLVSMLRADKTRRIFTACTDAAESARWCEDYDRLYQHLPARQGKAIVAEEIGAVCLMFRFARSLRCLLSIRLWNRDRDCSNSRLARFSITSSFKRSPRITGCLCSSTRSFVVARAAGRCCRNEIEPLLDKCRWLFRYLAGERTCLKVALPDEARQAYDQFHRQNMGTADLSATFSGAPRRAAEPEAADEPSSTSNSLAVGAAVATSERVHLPDGGALLQFNRRPKITFEQLQAETNIPEKDLQRALGALCMQKMARARETKEISSTDEFTVNDAFYSRHVKIKVAPSGGVKETETRAPRDPHLKMLMKSMRKYEIERRPKLCAFNEGQARLCSQLPDCSGD